MSGVLRGFDATMNLSLYSAIEEASATERNNIGTIVIRGMYFRLRWSGKNARKGCWKRGSLWVMWRGEGVMDGEMSA